MTLVVKDLESPLGTLRISARDGRLVEILFRDGPPVERGAAAVLDEAERQLVAYFRGERREFDLPLAPAGTSFQLAVWEALRSIPYGATVSYAEIARRVGRPSAVRAVGAANGRNPLPIVVPCHRVIGSDGSPTGYGGGIERKIALLRLERLGVAQSPMFRPVEGREQAVDS